MKKTIFDNDLRSKIIILLIILFPIQLVAQDFVWAKNIPNNINTGSVYIQDEGGVSIQVDNSGNIISTGNFEGTVDFDPSNGVTNLSTNLVHETYIQKLDANGNLLWVKQIGANGWFTTEAYSMTLDANDNIYITGTMGCNSFNPVDMDPGVGVFNLEVPGAFILKLDSNGDFIWAKSVGQDNAFSAFGTSVVVDNVNNVYVTGSHDGGDFDPGPNVHDISNVYGTFILKLDSNGDFVWAKSVENINLALYNGTVRGTGIAVDNLGGVYTIGNFRGEVDFDPSNSVNSVVSSIIPNAPLNDDIFIQKVDSNGDFLWVKTMGNIHSNRVFSIVLDNSANIYTTGTFTDTVDFDPGSNTVDLIALNSSHAAYIQKLDTDGNFLWAKSMASQSITGGNAEGRSITLDSEGSIYTTGEFDGKIDFNPDPTDEYINSFTNWNWFAQMVYVQKLDNNGDYKWTKFIDNSDGQTYSRDIQVDSDRNVYTAGSFNNTADFNPLDGGATITSASNISSRDDVFIQKLDSTKSTNVGIDENEFSGNLLIYPNPTSGDFLIDLGSIHQSTTVTVVDLEGRTIMEKNYKDKQLLNLSLIAAQGVYMVRVGDGEKMSIIKLTIE